MNKREIIKSRYELICKVEKTLNDNCRKCPINASRLNTIHDECLGCPALKELNELGKGIEQLTKDYRNKVGVKLNGEKMSENEKEEAVEVIFKPKDIIASKFNEEEFKIMRSRGLSVTDIANRYGVKSKNLYNFLGRPENKHLMESKSYPNNNIEYLKKHLSIEVIIEMIENGITYKMIREKHGITKALFDKWVKEQKELKGIVGKINKKSK